MSKLAESFSVAATALHDFAVAMLCCGVTGGAHPEGAPPAEYIWTHDLPRWFPDGLETPLCAACCAQWRTDAEARPELTPLRIRSIPKPVTDCADPVAWRYGNR
jgi:hypothetical protein